MIEDLTFELLGNYGFPKESIDRYKEWDNYESFHVNPPKGIYWASNIEGKVYSGIEGYRKYYFRNDIPSSFPKYCLDLFPEFIEARRLIDLQKQKDIAGSIFILEDENKEFYSREISILEKKIEVAWKTAVMLAVDQSNPVCDECYRLKKCIRWLEKKRDEPIQLETEILESIETTKIQPTATRRIIDEYFDRIKDQCFGQKEYKQFAEILTSFFDGTPYRLPKAPIELSWGSKTKIAAVFSPLRKAFHKKGYLIRDIEYLNLIKILSEFNNLDTDLIYKAISK